MGGLFGDPWKIRDVVEGDLLKVGADEQLPFNDQDLSEAEAIIAYVNSVASGLQPLDSDLTAIAALATTSFGRSLLALADAAALRITAGLVIGTDVQAADSDLTAIAALATTSFGRGLLTLADAAALRSAAGLGTAALNNTGDFQPADADLTAIAALVTTAFGRGFLDLADAAAARTKLALGTAAQSAVGDFQPSDADLTAIAALATTAFGRSVLTQADAAALRTLSGSVIGTNVQAFDSDLNSIAALATTSFGRGLLALADAAALRTTAGLVIGTDVQAFDSDLNSIAALATTSFGRGLLTLADAAAGRVALGVDRRGAMVKKSADQLGVDLSAGVSVGFDAEVYDTSAIHDLVTNNSRLSVPAGVTFVEVGATITFGNVTIGTDVTVIIRKNGATSYDGTVQMQIDAATAAPAINLRSGPIPVVGGTDYFELVVFMQTDISVDITAARTSFWMKIVE